MPAKKPSPPPKDKETSVVPKGNLTPPAAVPQVKHRETPNPILDTFNDEAERQLCADLAVELCRSEGVQNPHRFTFGVPKWHSNVRMARYLITAIRFMRQREAEAMEGSDAE